MRHSRDREERAAGVPDVCPARVPLSRRPPNRLGRRKKRFLPRRSSQQFIARLFPCAMTVAWRTRIIARQAG